VSTLPKVLYKYCDARGIDILLHRRLKVTPFNEFNDPFELAPRMRPDFPERDARLMLADTEFQLKLYQISVLKGDFTGPFDKFRDLLLRVESPLAAKAVEDYPKDAAEFRLNHQGTISREFGLICLSEVPHDILMWSHYTKGHTGLVIGFDTSNEFFAQSPVHKVDYKQERVLMGHWADLRDAPYRGKIINELIKTKSCDWSYEKEWRQMHILAQCLRDADSLEGDRYLYYKVISPPGVCEMIAGCRCDTAKINEVLSAPEFQHIKCRRARVHDTDFKLVLEDV
jgi:Protein of unknown function (DUF2971)